MLGIVNQVLEDDSAIVRSIAALFAAIIYSVALYLSIKARAPWAIVTWSLCLLITLPFIVLLACYGLGWIDRSTLTRDIEPLVVPSFIIIWFLPALEWIQRLVKANRIKVNNVECPDNL